MMPTTNFSLAIFQVPHVEKEMGCKKDAFGRDSTCTSSGALRILKLASHQKLTYYSLNFQKLKLKCMFKHKTISRKWI